ncbi:MAG TPA: hypothetical protein VKD26_07500 [Streptosporangiaceae bacterium]|nr:hypothetical protein [Streptosporangiaceae bacterium]
MTSPAAVISHAAAASPVPANSNDITPGVLGFLVIAALGVALYLLMRSMNKHLRRVRAVRDAGLAPGSDLAGTAASHAANGPAKVNGAPGAPPSDAESTDP